MYTNNCCFTWKPYTVSTKLKAVRCLQKHFSAFVMLSLWTAFIIRFITSETMFIILHIWFNKTTRKISRGVGALFVVRHEQSSDERIFGLIIAYNFRITSRYVNLLKNYCVKVAALVRVNIQACPSSSLCQEERTIHLRFSHA